MLNSPLSSHLGLYSRVKLNCDWLFYMSQGTASCLSGRLPVRISDISPPAAGIPQTIHLPENYRPCQHLHCTPAHGTSVNKHVLTVTTDEMHKKMTRHPFTSGDRDRVTFQCLNPNIAPLNPSSLTRAPSSFRYCFFTVLNRRL